MDIKKAMLTLIESDELVKIAGLSEVNRRFIKWKLVNNDPSLRDDTMKKWLNAAGFVEKSEWRPPGGKKNPRSGNPGVVDKIA